MPDYHVILSERVTADDEAEAIDEMRAIIDRGVPDSDFTVDVDPADPASPTSLAILVATLAAWPTSGDQTARVQWLTEANRAIERQLCLAALEAIAALTPARFLQVEDSDQTLGELAWYGFTDGAELDRDDGDERDADDEVVDEVRELIVWCNDGTRDTWLPFFQGRSSRREGNRGLIDLGKIRERTA